MRARRGFTLIELLVVVGVLGVLAAIAIPRFTGARNRAQDAVARADLRSAYTAALTARAAGGTWPDATALAATDAALRTTSGNATVGTISVANPAGTFRAAAVSAGGTCHVVTGDANGTATWTQTTDSPCTALPLLTVAYADQTFAAGVAETLSATVTGGLGSGRTFSLTAGTLPAGVTLDPTTGALTTTGLGGWSDGTLDAGFPGTAGEAVYSVAAQNDGKVVIGGAFANVNGTVRGGVARLNANGSLDTGFANGLTDATSVTSLAIQTDGKVVIGGTFGTIYGTSRGYVARLNTDGTLDTGFANGLSGANGTVSAIALQADGKVLIGGGFTTVNGTARNRIARLNADGTLDTGFGSGLAGANGWVEAIAVQSDGKVLIGGQFSSVNGTGRNFVARLNTDGSLDTGFLNGVTGPNARVMAVATLGDGRVVIGGTFTSVDGTARNRIARLNTDGTLDTGFAGGLTGVSGAVFAIAAQGDGRVIIGGGFTTVHGATRWNIARLNADGSLDTGFTPSADASVNAIALQTDRKVILGGEFSTVSGTGRSHVARLAGVSAPTGFPAAVTVQVAESGGGTASANLTLTVA